MFNVASVSSGNAKGEGFDVKLNSIKTFEFNGHTIEYFSIGNEQKNWTVWKFENNIYYCPSDEFKTTVDDIKSNSNGDLEFLDSVKKLSGCSITDRNGCMFIVDSIFGSLTGKTFNSRAIDSKFVNDSVTENSDEVNENIKIRKHNKLGTDGDVSKSIKYKEAKYGEKIDNDFKQEIEDEQKKDGVVGCLDQQQQESVKISRKPETVDVSEDTTGLKRLPNRSYYSELEPVTESAQIKLPKNRTKTSPFDGGEWNGEQFIFEPGDYVIFRLNVDYGEGAVWDEFSGQVTGVKDDVESGQIITILSYGHTVNVTPIDVRPDMNIMVRRNRFADAPDEPYRASLVGMGIDPKTRIADKVTNDVKDYAEEYDDFNEGGFFMGYLVKDGQVVSMKPYKISLKDVSESVKEVRALNEDTLVKVPIEDVAVDNEEWPWAVVVMNVDDNPNVEEEPLRKIRVNPVSYVEANVDDDGAGGLVDIILNGMETKMHKKYIRILS